MEEEVEVVEELLTYIRPNIPYMLTVALTKSQVWLNEQNIHNANSKSKASIT